MNTVAIHNMCTLWTVLSVSLRHFTLKCFYGKLDSPRCGEYELPVRRAELVISDICWDAVRLYECS